MKLILIPSFIGDKSDKGDISSNFIKAIENIKTFIVEDVRSARRYLRKAGYTADFDTVEFFELNKHTKDFSSYLDNSANGDIGLLSEAGMPCIAHPGSKIVALAHSKNITIVPLYGQSSIFLALMSSGMNGQNFAFNGYLPTNPSDREKKIKFFENLVERNNQTQMFIETPYRNNHLFKAFLDTCKPETMLCIASNLMCENEFIKTDSIKNWRKNNIDLHKKNTVFLIGQ